jgi:hypothetical protein
MPLRNACRGPAAGSHGRPGADRRFPNGIPLLGPAILVKPHQPSHLVHRIASLIANSRNMKTSTAPVESHVPYPDKAPGWSFQNRRCHLFNLFYQVQIRLGSPELCQMFFASHSK